jgi:hypothetical protein
MSAFERVANKLQDTKFVIPVTLAVMLGVVIGAFAFYEDYQSSLHGYNLLPTRKTGQEVVQVVALLPQVGQIIFFYMFGNSIETTPNGKRRINYIYFTVAFFLLLFDLGTDVYFKASGMSLAVWVIALVESITVFTIGSEMLLTASLGLFFELFPEALKQLGHIFARFVGDEDEPVRQVRQGGHQR